MQIGNVIIIDGKVGVISEQYMKVIRKEDLTCAFEVTMLQGVYLTGEQFNVSVKDNYIVLNENLVDYINRHVQRFGKLKVENKRKAPQDV